MPDLDLVRLIDHTDLRPGATKDEIKALCLEAAKWNFKAVCVNTAFVKLAAQELAGTGVSVCTVVGFPLGATTTGAKVFEAREALENGADEIDMVINVGALKAGDDDYVVKEIQRVVAAANGAVVKVIIETCLLTDPEKRKASQLVAEAGAHFVKTSTGFSSGGAKVEDIILIKNVVGDNVGIKASGGIRDKNSLLAMVSAGASRIGTSNGIKIITS